MNTQKYPDCRSRKRFFFALLATAANIIKMQQAIGDHRTGLERGRLRQQGAPCIGKGQCLTTRLHCETSKGHPRRWFWPPKRCFAGLIVIGLPVKQGSSSIDPRVDRSGADEGQRFTTPCRECLPRHGPPLHHSDAGWGFQHAAARLGGPRRGVGNPAGMVYQIHSGISCAIRS